MKNTYKEIFDDIKPSEKLVDSVFEMRDKKKKSFVLKLVSAVLAFAVFATATGFGIQYHNEQKVMKNPIGNVMLVNASEAIGQASTRIGYRIFTTDITDMTEQEIYDAKLEMLDKKLHYSIDDEFTLNDGLKNAVFQNGNVIYATEKGSVYTELILKNIENPEEVESINVSNTSEYANPVICADDIYYTETEDNVFVFDNRNVDDSQSCIEGHNIYLNGERYYQCIRLENKNAKHYTTYYEKDGSKIVKEISDSNDRSFYITYMWAEEFYDALGKNPKMDLTSYSDELTVKVDFKNGNTATTVLSVGIDEKGYLTLNCKSYDYSKR